MTGTLLAAPPVALIRGATLLLDFDGTLVEIAERPDAVQVTEQLRALMHRLLERLDGRVAIVSGRPAAQVRALIGEPVLTVVGSHGLEFVWADGRSHIPARPAGLADALAAMQALAERHPGVFVEDKPLGVALHFRQAPGAGNDCHDLAARLAAEHGLFLQPGKMMIEVRAAAGDKGGAVRALMAEPELASARPLFMGDDHTDEPGFAAAAALGGAGILVGPVRPTAARYGLEDVDAALAWLTAAAAAA